MDRRQLLDNISATIRFGSLADDVVLACEHIRAGVPLQADRDVILAASDLMEGLSEPDQPGPISPDSLARMAAHETLSGPVEHYREGDHEAIRELLDRTREDLQELLTDAPGSAALDRVEEFFEYLAEVMLESSEALTRPHGVDAAWTPRVLF